MQVQSIPTQRAMQYLQCDQRPTSLAGGPIIIKPRRADVTDRVVRNTSKHHPDNGHKEAERTDQRQAFLTDPARESSGNTFVKGTSEALPNNVISIRYHERAQASSIGGPRTMEQSTTVTQ